MAFDMRNVVLSDAVMGEAVLVDGHPCFVSYIEEYGNCQVLVEGRSLIDKMTHAEVFDIGATVVVVVVYDVMYEFVSWSDSHGEMVVRDPDIVDVKSFAVTMRHPDFEARIAELKEYNKIESAYIQVRLRSAPRINSKGRLVMSTVIEHVDVQNKPPSDDGDFVI